MNKYEECAAWIASQSMTFSDFVNLDVTERPATADDVALGLAEQVGDLLVIDKSTGALLG